MSWSDAFKPGLLEGKKAFITGGTSGINLGIARALARYGSSVAILGRNADKARAAADVLRDEGSGDVLALTADVRDYEPLEACVTQASESFGGLDILVCGAAGNFPAPAAAMSANGFKAVVDIDLLGTFNATKAAFNHLRKPGACVVNISAPQAYMPTPLQSHVCAAKAGVDMLTKTLAMEWGPLGVRVNAVTPGPVDGTEGMARLAPDEEARERCLRSVPLRRFAEVEEMGELVVFLSSPVARYVHGCVLVADGGWSLGGAAGFFPGA